MKANNIPNEWVRWSSCFQNLATSTMFEINEGRMGAWVTAQTFSRIPLDIGVGKGNLGNPKLSSLTHESMFSQWSRLREGELPRKMHVNSKFVSFLPLIGCCIKILKNFSEIGVASGRGSNTIESSVEMVLEYTDVTLFVHFQSHEINKWIVRKSTSKIVLSRILYCMLCKTLIL